MAISEAEQRRLMIRAFLLLVPGFVASALVTITFGDTLISWADNWPGGPTGFTVTLGAVSGLSFLLLCVALLAHGWPEYTPPSLRISPRAGLFCAVVGCIVLAFTAVPLGSTMDRPGGSDDSNCDLTDDFGCYLRTLHSEAVTWGLIAFIAALAAAAGTTTWIIRRTQRTRKDQAGGLPT